MVNVFDSYIHKLIFIITTILVKSWVPTHSTFKSNI